MRMDARKRWTRRSERRVDGRRHHEIMRKVLSFLFVSALGLCGARGQTNGFLHAHNARIINGQGNEVILRGMGLGGWMLQEGYMLGIKGEGTQHSIKARITDLIGKADANKFYQLWL